MSSFFLARLNKNVTLSGLPFSLSIEPTTACNLRCPECPSGLRSFTRPTGTLSKLLFNKIIKENYERLIYLIFYFQGEPYIHPSFLEMVKEAHAKNIYTITSTNGHFLNDDSAMQTVLSGLDRLIISVDGTTQEVYEQYRKTGKLENVLQGARNVVKWKKMLNSQSPHIIFQMLVVRPNEHQIEDLKILAKEIGIDEVKLKTAQLYDFEHGHELMPQNNHYSRYKKGPNGKYHLVRSIKNECWKMWHSAVITWDGNVVPCCFDKDAQHIMGNVQDYDLKQIWNGADYNQFRKTMIQGRDKIDICQNCSEGCTVWK